MQSHGEQINVKQAALQGFADSQEEFQRLGGLQDTDESGRDAQDAGIGAIWRILSIDRFRKQTSVAQPLAVRERCVEKTHLPFEPVNGTVDPRYASAGTGIGNGISGLKIICTING